MAKNYIANKLTPTKLSLAHGKEPIMRRLVKRAIKSKNKAIKAVAVNRFKDYEQMEIDSKAALIQELIPLGLMHIEELLQDEVSRLAGATLSVETNTRETAGRAKLSFAGIQAMGKSEGVQYKPSVKYQIFLGIWGHHKLWQHNVLESPNSPESNNMVALQNPHAFQNIIFCGWKRFR